MGDATKMDEFSEKSQTAFDPHPPCLFLENQVAIFVWKRLNNPVYRSKICNIYIWIENDPPPPIGNFRIFILFGSVTCPYPRTPKSQHLLHSIGRNFEEVH